jgi:hypothetical protein
LSQSKYWDNNNDDADFYITFHFISNMLCRVDN